jgi:hypothetical protein
VAPNKALAAGGVLCCAVALPIVVDDTSFLAKPALADALPTCELLLAPRSHFLNQTLLL